MKQDLKDKVSKMSDEEFKKFLKDKDHESSASVSDVIDFLKKNFNGSDKLCWIDCVEGCKYDCLPLYVSDLGKTKFRYVKDAKEKNLKLNPKLTKEIEDSFYPYVDDCDILIY